MKLPGSKKKKTVSCPRCNAPVPTDVAFCEACGARIGAPPACSLCGTMLAPNSRFCPSCGTMVGHSKDHPLHNEQVPAGEPVTETPESPATEAVPARKPKSSKAKKPKEPEPEPEEKKPDPLMMIPEPDQPEPEVAPAAPVPVQPVQKEAPPSSVPSSVVTAPPPSGKRMLIPSGISRKNGAVIAGVVLVLVAAVLVFAGFLHIPGLLSPSGNAAPPVTVTATPAPEVTEIPVTPDEVATIVPETTAETISLVPGPTQVPPERFLVYFEATRNSFTRNVTVLYKGGKGQMAVREVAVRLTRSDGKVVTGTFKPVQVDSGIDLPGTDRTDRVEVTVRYVTGEEYKVMDRVFEYKKQL